MVFLGPKFYTFYIFNIYLYILGDKVYKVHFVRTFSFN